MAAQTELLLLGANVASLGRLVKSTETETGRLGGALRELEARVRHLEGEPHVRMMRLREVAERIGLSMYQLGVDRKSGLLEARNISAYGRAPRWRVTEEQFSEYLRKREGVTA